MSARYSSTAPLAVVVSTPKKTAQAPLGVMPNPVTGAAAAAFSFTGADEPSVGTLKISLTPEAVAGSARKTTRALSGLIWNELTPAFPAANDRPVLIFVGAAEPSTGTLYSSGMER